MTAYVDGFIMAVPKARLDEYWQMARVAREVWLELGATEYVEALGDDVPVGERTSFPRSVQLEADEVVVFSWVTYPSKAVREEAHAKVMHDARFAPWKDNWPFDGKRMIYGGFVPIVAGASLLG